MEYVEGMDLHRLVRRRGVLAVDQALDYICQAARGLEFAHARGVVHRDVKPGNLLLDKHGTAKILDLGLARLQSIGDGFENVPLTHENAIVGTIDYMSPEQAENANAVDPRSDIYSLGCTPYYLLIGASLHASGGAMQRLLAHREKPAPSLRESRVDVSDALDAVFHRMIALKPANRYASMTEVISALERFPVPTMPPGITRRVAVASHSGHDSDRVETTEQVTRASVVPAGRNRTAAMRWLWLVGSTLLLGLLGVLIYAFGFGPETPPPPDYIHLTFEAPVPSTLRDRDGNGTGFTTRLPGTGSFLPENDPHLQLTQGALLITSTYANFHYRGINLGVAEAPGVLLKAPSNRDIEVSTLVQRIAVPHAADQVFLYVATSASNLLRGGFHQEGFYILLENNASTGNLDKPIFTSSIRAFSQGDDVALSLIRRKGLWSLAWNNLSNPPVSGRSASFQIPSLESVAELYVGIFAANAGAPVPHTNQVNYFTALVGNQLDGQKSGARLRDKVIAKQET
jgi:hypothetical protein